MNEQDPLGTDQHSPGAKLDKGKPMADLVLSDFSRALYKVIEVGTYGAEKYSKHGWLSVPDGQKRYSDAMVRHYLEEKISGPVDEETGLLHAAQLAWNALARLELYLRDKNHVQS